MAKEGVNWKERYLGGSFAQLIPRIGGWDERKSSSRIRWQTARRGEFSAPCGGSLACAGVCKCAVALAEGCPRFPGQAFGLVPSGREPWIRQGSAPGLGLPGEQGSQRSKDGAEDLPDQFCV